MLIIRVKEMMLKLLAPAKVNLYLKVKGKRQDGYHNIETFFERLGLFDKVILRKQKKGIAISCNKKDVPTHKRSLCYKAASILKKRFNVDCGVNIRIVKNIPLASGLGGGSSDAACILLGLNRLWGLGLKGPGLIELGKGLGADVPFFLMDTSFAVGKERGDKLLGIDLKRRFWHIIISPRIKILSGDIYGIFDRTERNQGSRQRKGLKELLKSLKKGDIRKITGFLINDLEKAVLKKSPGILSLKQDLEKSGCGFSLISGSGPSVFGLFRTRKEAVAAKRALQRLSPAGRKEARIFVVATY